MMTNVLSAYEQDRVTAAKSVYRKIVDAANKYFIAKMLLVLEFEVIRLDLYFRYGSPCYKTPSAFAKDFAKTYAGLGETTLRNAIFTAYAVLIKLDMIDERPEHNSAAGIIEHFTALVVSRQFPAAFEDGLTRALNLGSGQTVTMTVTGATVKHWLKGTGPFAPRDAAELIEPNASLTVADSQIDPPHGPAPSTDAPSLHAPSLPAPAPTASSDIAGLSTAGGLSTGPVSPPAATPDTTSKPADASPTTTPAPTRATPATEAIAEEDPASDAETIADGEALMEGQDAALKWIEDMQAGDTVECIRLVGDRQHIQLLMTGRFAPLVLQGTLNGNETICVVKFGRVGTIDTEDLFLNKLKSPFVVEGQGLIGAIDSDENLRAVGMLMASGTPFLEHILNVPPDGVELVRASLDICNAVRHIHTFGVFHLDIKPDNFVVKGNGDAVLIDFEISKNARKGQIRTEFLGACTPAYAPIIEVGTLFNLRKFDMYSVAITLYSVCLPVRTNADDVRYYMSEVWPTDEVGRQRLIAGQANMRCKAVTSREMIFQAALRLFNSFGKTECASFEQEIANIWTTLRPKSRA